MISNTDSDVWIKTLTMNNFRMYKHLEVSFEKDYTVLIGLNGAGKSTILDALSVALGTFTGVFTEKAYYTIKNRDARIETAQMGSRIDAQHIYPAEVECDGFIGTSEPVRWKRALNGKDRKNTRADAAEIMNIAKDMLGHIREPECILPIFASYGTGRLWAQTYSKSFSSEQWNRQGGYDDCLNASMNQRKMIKWFQDMTLIGIQNNEPVPELNAVEKAIAECFIKSEKTIQSANIFYSIKDKALVIDIKRDDGVQRLPIDMLSDGERDVIILVADIAYRMALLNPQLLDRVLETPGIVLIDEIDMHLHPQWQKYILTDLKKVFPNVQFIVTTHSPTVINNISAEHVRIVDGKNAYEVNRQTYGRDLNDIMLDLMGIDVRPQEIISLQSEFDKAVDDDDLSKAENVLDHMKKLMGENSSEVIKNQIALDVERIDV